MNKSLKKMVLKRVPYSKLLKNELPSLAKDVIRVVERHNPEELLIKDVCDLLVAETPQIVLLSNRHGVHPLSLKLIPMREKLMLSVSAIKFQLRVVSSDKDPDVQKDATVVRLALNRNLYRLQTSSKNETSVNDRIDHFLYEVENDAELSGALRSLGLMTHIENLELAHADVQNTLSMRTKSISERSKETSKEIGDFVIFALKNVFKQVELAKVKNKEIDYQPLFNELNDTVIKYRIGVKVREANNKRKAEERKAIEMGEAIDVGDSTESIETPDVENREMIAPSVLMASTDESKVQPVEKDSINGIDDNSDKSLEQKKTAALSSKPLQLPDSKKEGK